MEDTQILTFLPDTLKEKRVAYVGQGDASIRGTLKNKGAFVDTIDPLGSNLKSELYDYILCINSIASLTPKQQRLFMSELSHLLKKKGKIIFSTPLDYRTQDPSKYLAALIETEFQIEENRFKNDRLYLTLERLFGKKIKKLLDKKRVEKISRFLFPETGISHAIFVASRKSLVEPTEEERHPKVKERKWE